MRKSYLFRAPLELLLLLLLLDEEELLLDPELLLLEETLGRELLDLLLTDGALERLELEERLLTEEDLGAEERLRTVLLGER